MAAPAARRFAMNRDQALDILRTLREPLRQLGVTELALFGSVARDQASASSDVDVLVELQPGDFWRQYNQVLDTLEAAFPCRVDLVPKVNLKPQLRERVLGEAIHVA